MKILIAPDSFKGSLTALEVAESIERGLLAVESDLEIIKIPMADGGEGTVRSLIDAMGGELIFKEVIGPTGKPVKAHFGFIHEKRLAVIEMASASGLVLMPPGEADPMKTTTYGTGELIKAALDQGAEKLIIGIGGSATNDAGVGMAQALGIDFLDECGENVGPGGGELNRIKSINLENLDPRIKRAEIKVACDVNNPLYGPDGAAFVYGPQKGATPEMVRILDNNLRHLAMVIKRDLKRNVQDIPGAGAAGGLGAGLVAFLNAELKSGVDIVLETNGLAEKLKGVDLVITGEGRIDGQTIKGKTPIGVARKAKEFGLPVIAICGMVGDNANLVYQGGIDAVFSIIQQPATLEEAIDKASEWVQFTAEQIFRVYRMSITRE